MLLNSTPVGIVTNLAIEFKTEFPHLPERD